MATNARAPPSLASNGVVPAPPKGSIGGNRKKQKRRAKQAAKAATHPPMPPPANGQDEELDYAEDALRYNESYDSYSEDELDDARYPPQHQSHAGANGYAVPPPAASNKRNKKKKSMLPPSAYNPDRLASQLPPLPTPPPPPPGTASAAAMHALQKRASRQQDLWNTSTQQERQNIKNFWLSLSEDERKSLLKIEKEAVLRKMKQQQKSSCSCTVCGRKRTAIEEELEVLYEGYYEELEQYAHHDHPPLPSINGGLMPDPLQHRRMPHPLTTPPPASYAPRQSQIHEHLDEDELSEDEEEEEYSDDEEEEEYSDEEPLPPRGGQLAPHNDGMMPPPHHHSGANMVPPVPDFFNFGQNLTVKDNLLTVADDLLKNDGRKFIEMMEQLAERRMQRESEAEYAAASGPGHAAGPVLQHHHQQQGPSLPGGYPPDPVGHYGEDALAAGEEYDDDEASYDSQEEYDDDLEEEDEMGGLTEEQRMQEGRRMFQIFAARMFEQRVLTAYREKVAAERQQKLLEELDDEDEAKAKREAKKKRDAEKKKDKKKQQQQAKAEEKAKREAEKAAEEARIRESEEKKLEEQRRKREEQRKKKEEEKRKLDDERARKEAEKLRRQQEEQERREEAERKARELKAAEKAKKEEARKREREEREAREKEARERKALEDREKKEREARAKAEQETKGREKAAQQAAQPPQEQQRPLPQITKRPSQPGMVAVPGVYAKQTPSGISSPMPAIAMPAVPKAPTPAKQRQASQQGSHASSPKQTQSQGSSAPSKSSSPGSAAAQQQHQNAGLPKQIMQKPGHPQQQGPQMPPFMQTTSPLHQHPIQPPPGMPHPQQHPGGFSGMPPIGFPGFQGQHGPMMHGGFLQRGPMPGFLHQGPPMGVPNRMSFGGPGMNGMPVPPPGMMPPPGRGMAFPFDGHGAGAPPGFHQQPPPHSHPPSQTSPVGPLMNNAASSGEAPRPHVPGHSRQQSTDKERFESAANQPIARPAPIQRPSSVKPPYQDHKGFGTDMDDLSNHLGSSALLADDDEPLPSNPADTRRRSNIPTSAPNNGPLGSIGGFGSPAPNAFGGPSTWNTPSLPFGQPSGLGQQNWGQLPTPGSSIGGGWANNNAAFAANNAFGAIGAAPLHHRTSAVGQNRPFSIRLAVCQACKQLSNASRGEGDGWHGVDVLLRQIEHNRPMLDAPPSLQEIEEICETEGDSQNGGGELHVRRAGAGGAAGSLQAVKWEPDVGTPDHLNRGGASGLGEIGSPMPAKTSPAGFGAPGMGRGGGSQSLGAVGSSGF